MALVERDLVTDVPRGENAGRRLAHENVVRAFERVGIASDGQGEVRLQLPEGVQVGKASVIGYVQDQRSMRILGALGVDLGSGTGS